MVVNERMHKYSLENRGNPGFQSGEDVICYELRHIGYNLLKTSIGGTLQ
ncbi:MAG: hypothetical protein UW88_C0014G0035 [Candidatus Collierbacteria bacterium GW2011_GWD2_45_10]|uniref:Uncharacterized protein n=1 Tax=Candidatus Collierbacteria bacterium GW2011_GWB2_44_22 TaxID=1618387 RepID=A0A0G1HW53_9BACT|nr:MAG: hypothetical protein UW31_C0012G0034 [Candidatus Collierbacteria bacterium GW2011_GWA2_44_13]KKT51150.1 MAG: hypothetical protein UW44_C0015G0021 [Candidatus Collierbacteria bacterium GW2011_GWB2_44_22]KKT88170.1 MAG: hypothetical protein UW88_C0014G0035 [Candidatus Collierbacteria bacterium GW2011_GWD2_45_10]